MLPVHYHTQEQLRENKIQTKDKFEPQRTQYLVQRNKKRLHIGCPSAVVFSFFYGRASESGV